MTLRVLYISVSGEMEAAACTAYGPPEMMVIRDLPKPNPGRNDVCIRVHAAALTTSDTRIRALQFPRRLRLPLCVMVGIRAPRRVMGLELCNVILTMDV